jgi:hypothetical protein
VTASDFWLASLLQIGQMKKAIASQFRVVTLTKVVINFNFYERLKSEKLYEVIIVGIEGFKRKPDFSDTFDIFQWFLRR